LFRSARLALTGASLSSLSWAHGVTVLWGTERPALVLAAENNYVEGALIHDGRIYATNMPGADPAQLVPASASQLMRSSRIEANDQIRIVPHGAASAATGLEAVEMPVDGSNGTISSFGALSTALLGIVRSSFRLNLIPPPLRYQRNPLQIVPTYALIVLLALLGLFALVREPYQQSVYAEQLDQEGRRLAVVVRPVADQEARLNKVSDRLKTLDGLIRGRDGNLEALRELSRVLPQTAWLLSYSCQDNVVTIMGYSESASSLQKLLEDSPVFREVQFTSSIIRDSSGKDRFTLRAAIEVRP
jgi:Tfp pilus assembly protein PilN